MTLTYDPAAFREMEVTISRLERENQELKHTLIDAFAAAALASGKSPYEAFAAARECMNLRKRES
jgi:hypothetical protein